MKTHLFKPKTLSKSILLGLFLFLIIGGNAQVNDSDSMDISNKKEFKQSINFCPGAIAFGVFTINYERLLSEHHGLMIRADYESVPKSYSDANINTNGKAAILNYRYHLQGGLNSWFIGAFSRYRVYNGDGALNGSAFDFKLSEVTVGVNAGKRWVFNNGININAALGYGLFMDDQTQSDSSADVLESINEFKDNYSMYNGLFMEFSLGYAF